MRRLLGIMFSRRWILITFIVLAICAVFVRLGFWQLSRLQERLAFNAHYFEVRAMPPLDLNTASSADLTTMEYRNVTVTGKFDSQNQVVLLNQYNDKNVLGYHLLTPLLLDNGSAVLVERGWIPADGNKSPSDWHQYDQAGEVTLSGILRLGQAAPELGGVPNPTLTPGQTRLDFWYLIDLNRIGQQLPYPLLPVYVQPNVDAADTRPPIPFQPDVDTSNGPHLSYAIQWFSFATILFLAYPLLYLRKQEK